MEQLEQGLKIRRFGGPRTAKEQIRFRIPTAPEAILSDVHGMTGMAMIHIMKMT